MPYSFGLRGEDPQPVRAVLTAASGAVLELGPAEAPSLIEGELGAFCRVGAQRLTPQASELSCNGPYGEIALAALRNYAA